MHQARHSTSRSSSCEPLPQVIYYRLRMNRHGPYENTKSFTFQDLLFDPAHRDIWPFRQPAARERHEGPGRYSSVDAGRTGALCDLRTEIKDHMAGYRSVNGLISRFPVTPLLNRLYSL